MIKVGKVQEHIIAAARLNPEGRFYIGNLPRLDPYFRGWEESEVMPSINRLVDRGLLKHSVDGFYQLSDRLQNG